MARKNRAGVWILLAVIAADVLAISWYRHWKAQTHESFNATGLNLSSVPAGDPAFPPSMRPARAARAGGPTRVESVLPSVAPETQLKLAGSGAQTRPSALSGKTNDIAMALYRVQSMERYRKSPTILNWRYDFSVYPDLKAIQRKFWRDRDLASFVSLTAQSPNFAKMLKKYGAQRDLQDFVRDVMKDKTLMDAGHDLFENKQVMESVKNIAIPGLPSIGALMAAGASGKAPQINLNMPDADKLQKSPGQNDR